MRRVVCNECVMYTLCCITVIYETLSEVHRALRVCDTRDTIRAAQSSPCLWHTRHYQSCTELRVCDTWDTIRAAQSSPCLWHTRHYQSCTELSVSVIHETLSEVQYETLSEVRRALHVCDIWDTIRGA